MKQAKKFLVLLLSAMLLLSLAACAGGNETEADQPQVTDTPEATKAPEAEPEQSAEPEGTVAADGVYETSAMGRNGLVNVTTTIKDGKIAAVELGDNMETDVFANPTVPALLEEIVANNSYNVDGVSGATWTYSAIKTCVRSAVEEAGGTPELYAVHPEAVQDADETVDADVAVVGAGISGIMAAARAGSQGAKVVLIEKTSLLGGCSLQSFAAAHYTEDTIPETFINWIENNHFMVDTTVLHAYLTNNDAALEYLKGFNYFPYAPDNWFLTAYTDRAGIYDNMMETQVIANGGKVYTETTATGLLTNDGAVTGVVAKRKDGSVLTVNAKAVVIATGGYGGNTDMVEETSGLDVVCGCLTQDTGEGLEMAWAVGAAKARNLGGLQLHQTLATAQLTQFDYFHMRMPMILGYVPSVLNVNKQGIRFRNEEWVNTATYASGSGAATGGYTYVLIDQSMIDKLTTGGLQAIGTDVSPGMPPEYKPDFELDTPWTDCKAVVDAMVEGGWGYFGDTIEELAKNAGMDPAVLRDTFDTYQSYCQNGEDTFMSKDPKYLVAYEQGPYYLVEITYNQLGTISGLVINANAQVLDDESKPISGLYSVGADASSVLYDNNYSGMGDAIGWAITSGYMGGTSAAEYALN